MRMAAPTSTLVVTREVPLPTMTSRVDPQGARRMMEMLVNLYADRRLAVVREYVSNAVDATRVAGCAEPVRVTTPTQIDPSLIVNDRGTGMSTSEVEATFLAFAASTKRDSDELIGGLGIGAKCTWTLAESFLVDTVKNGRRTTVRAARDLSHQVLLAGEPSDLLDGTTIIVPVDLDGTDAASWQRVIQGVASAHPEGAVLVDGEAVSSLDGGPSWVGPISCRRLSGEDEQPVMVRSGGTLFASVPEVSNRAIQRTKLSGCLIELPIGSFDHTPSRETVIATARTLAAVDAALAAYEAAYEVLEQRVATLAETDVPAAMLLRANTLGDVGTSEHLPIPFQIEVPDEIKSWKLTKSHNGRQRWVRIDNTVDADTFDAIDAAAEMRRTILVTGVPARRGLHGFAAALGAISPYAQRVIPVLEGEASVTLPVLDAKGNSTAQTWEIDAETAGVTHCTFTQWKAEIATGRTTRGPAAGYNCVLVANDGAAPVPVALTGPEIAEMGLPVWYASGDRPNRYSTASPAVVEVYLGKRLERPLLAAVPAAMTRSVWIESRFAAATAGWSDTELLAAAFAHPRERHCAKVFAIAAAALGRNPASAALPALLTVTAAIIAASEQITPERAETLQAVSNCESARGLFAKLEALRAELIRAYPLLKHLRGWDEGAASEEFIEYVVHTPPRPLDSNRTADIQRLLDSDLADAA